MATKFRKTCCMYVGDVVSLTLVDVTKMDLSHSLPTFTSRVILHVVATHERWLWHSSRQDAAEG